MTHTFTTTLPGVYDHTEPEVTVTADVEPPVAPTPTQDHDNPGFSDPGSAGECRLVSVEMDPGRDILEQLPGWIRERLEKEAMERFEE